jgi:hypothetical protein
VLGNVRHREVLEDEHALAVQAGMGHVRNIPRGPDPPR